MDVITLMVFNKEDKNKLKDKLKQLPSALMYKDGDAVEEEKNPLFFYMSAHSFFFHGLLLSIT